jgi:hypothetical protein
VRLHDRVSIRVRITDAGRRAPAKSHQSGPSRRGHAADENDGRLQIFDGAARQSSLILNFLCGVFGWQKWSGIAASPRVVCRDE